jgi:transposase
MLTHKSNDYKLSAVKYYLSHSKNQVQTCKIFGCAERSLMRWVDKYKSTNHITWKKRDYTSYKITSSHISYIKQQLKKNKTITMDELVKNVKDVLDEIPIHIYKNLIRGAYDRNEKYVKLPLTRKRKPKKYLD